MVNFDRRINFLPWRQLELQQVQRSWAYQLLWFFILTNILLLILYLGLKLQIEKLQQQQKDSQLELEQLKSNIKQQRLQKMLVNEARQQRQLLDLLSYLPPAMPTVVHLTQIQQQENKYIVEGLSADAIAVMQLTQGLKNACKTCEIKLLYLNQNKPSPENLFKLQVSFL